MESTTNLPVLPALRIDDSTVGERQEELARLVLNVDEASNEIVYVLYRRDLGRVDVPERHVGLVR